MSDPHLTSSNDCLRLDGEGGWNFSRDKDGRLWVGNEYSGGWLSAADHARIREWLNGASAPETTSDVVKACHATIGVLARRVVHMGNPLRDHACPECMPEGGPMVNPGFTCSFHLASYFVTCPEYQLPELSVKSSTPAQRVAYNSNGDAYLVDTSSEKASAPLSMDETQRVLGSAPHETMSRAAALDRFLRRHDVNVTDEQIKHMVNRFLGWRLPENFRPDAGISFKPTFNDHMPTGPQKHNPTGTNLFDAEQAEAMVRYMIDGMPCSEENGTGDGK